MSPATAPRDDPRTTRLLAVDAATGRIDTGTVADLARLLQPGDLLVCNDAATLPAALRGHTAGGAAVEVRLAGERPDGTFGAVLFGDGDWRMRTEDRPPPPRLALGARLQFDGLGAEVAAVDAGSPRLVGLRFDRGEEELWRALYAAGRPVQYSYLRQPLRIWDVQTPFAARPWAVEPPSAALPLSFELLLQLRRRGVLFARVTHAAGLSSTGDPALDARLPFAERFEVPAATVRAVAAARQRGGRVVAVGTTVARALESAAAAGTLVATSGWTGLRLGAGTTRAVVDGILTGIHEQDSSHFALLTAFAPRELLLAANACAEAAGFLLHEFGDAMLLLGTPVPRPRDDRALVAGGDGRAMMPGCASPPPPSSAPLPSPHSAPPAPAPAATPARAQPPAPRSRARSRSATARTSPAGTPTCRPRTAAPRCRRRSWSATACWSATASPRAT